MNTVGLPARVGYAVASLAAVGAVGFYASIWLLPKFVSQAAEHDDGYGIFRMALGIALGLGVTAALVGLTLPWKRRKRRGRGRRIGIASVIVVLLSVAFASQQHRVIYDLLFAAWLAYVLAFTYVRYGVLDKPKASVSREAAAEAESE
jgi:Kef-type K+ transport system membrane component KefB